MAITRKPKTQTSTTNPPDVEALIAKGGSTARAGNDSLKEEEAITAFTLRVPNDILRQVDNHRKNGPYKIARQQWVLEAIVQRLERDTS